MIGRFFLHSILYLVLLLLSASINSCRLSKAFHSQPVQSYDRSNGIYSSAIDSNDYIQLEAPPENKATSKATVFLETVERISRADTAFIIIKGNFANGCSHLQNVTHSIDNQVLRLYFEAWQPKNKMCTQVLTPFSYLYPDLSTEEVHTLRYYIRQGEKISF